MVEVATAANRPLAVSSVASIFPILTLPAIRDLRDRRSLMTGASRSDLHLRDSVLAVQDITEIPINHLPGRHPHNEDRGLAVVAVHAVVVEQLLLLARRQALVGADVGCVVDLVAREGNSDLLPLDLGAVHR